MVGVTITGNLAVSGTCSGSATCDADIAEGFLSNSNLQPGDVVVLDSFGYKTLNILVFHMTKLLAGVISTNPTITMGNNDEYNLPLALTGVVPTKVTTENGPIEVGDILTTSSTLGHAMKCLTNTNEQKMKCFGATIGKALESCNEERCEIMILINLQ